MSHHPFQPPANAPDPDPPGEDKGLSLAQILELPDRERRIVNTILRHKDCTLHELAATLGESETTLQPEVDTLLRQGWIAEREREGQFHYTVQLSAKRGIDLPSALDRLGEIPEGRATPADELCWVAVGPQEEVAARAGDRVELRVSATNRGRRDAAIEAILAETSAIPENWCTSREERLALGPGYGGELVFEIAVPVEAIAGIYPYAIVVSASEHYPEQPPARLVGQLRVLEDNL